jgi:O-antigen/teichoic acid export membrane protein
MLKLQNKITLSARLIILLSLPIGIILIFFGKVFLSIYGTDFAIGLSSLRILCIGQLVNASVGSVGLLLIMTGHERDSAWGIGLGAIANVILNFLLIPPWGIDGAAIATSSSMVIWNIILMWFVWKRLGIFSTALGKINRCI